jgi:hypothetical protein
MTRSSAPSGRTARWLHPARRWRSFLSFAALVPGLLATPSGARAAPSACTVRRFAGTIWIDDLDSGVRLPDDAGQVVTLGAQGDGVLFATAADGPPPGGSPSLWRARCGGATVTEVARVAGADFGHAALARDGRTLLFTGADGAAALDLDGGTVHAITHAVAPAGCPRATEPPRDLVRALRRGDGELLLARGAACGDSGYLAETVHVADPLGPRPTEHAPHPIVALANDGAGTLYLADETPGVLWRSSDAGATWNRLSAGDAAIAEVLVDVHRPSHLAVRTRPQGALGGWLLLSEDGGQSWRSIAQPWDEPSGYARMRPDVRAAVLADGSADTPIVRAFSNGRGEQTVASSDGGRSWHESRVVVPPSTLGPAAIAGSTFHPTDDGLVRRAPDGGVTTVFPDLRPVARWSPAPCQPELDGDRHITIDGFETGMSLAPEDDVGDPAFAVFRAGAVTTLFALLGRRHGSADGSVLRRITCGAPPTVTPLLIRPGADFGRGALTADRRTLFFTDADGVAALDLAHLKIRKVMAAPSVSRDCQAYPATAHVTVVALHDGDTELEVAIRDCSGDEATWSTRFIDDPLGRARVRRASLVTALVRDAGGRIWAGLDDDRGCAPRVWRSDDRGARWRRVPGPKTSLTALLPDAHRPDLVVAATQSGCIPPMADPLPDAWLGMTRDGGRTWRDVADPLPDKPNRWLGDVELVGGSAERLRVRVSSSPGDGASLEHGDFESHDGGATWTPSPIAPAPAEPRRGPLVLGDVTLNPSTGGVLRAVAGGPRRRVRP